MSTTYKSPRKKLPSGVKTTSEIILDITSGLSRTLLNIDSLYKDFMQPESIGYFSEKHNFLNQFIVKLGWFWTLSLTIPFVYIISHTNHSGNYQFIIKDLFGLIFATISWYICTEYFIWHEKQTGICKIENNFKKSIGREICHTSGGIWINGFDISGHCFLMIYSSLILSEEGKRYKWWLRTETRDKKKITQILFSLMGLLDLIWIFQLIITSLYYHTTSHKFFGALFGVGCWFLTHGMSHFGRILKGINKMIDYNPRRVKSNNEKNRKTR
ncbi:Fat storage-inducing transmembrane protein 2 [Strongyloides ratti]|uniref:Fat storage-inducing transmembrane protein 2 n=1 Tax=Strongyloides ratti TaxID=34506 RepID=A0A090LBK6_STRRB|nr:Fat storage-inducing transmembrane protein 2 [Strongyloides ratti]CEF65513.1 Fat storage-inducing transmembrane protein 2 [Strongyloides ratti]